MPSQIIQWFPGHMAKTRRLISENISNVDFVIELLDARIPFSSRNPEIIRLTAGKPSLILLNKASLADPQKNAEWLKYYTGKNSACLLTDCTTGEGLQKIPAAVRSLMHEKLERYEAKGCAGRKLRAMVLGIPNVGKSSLINRLAGSKKAKVENRPGVTLTKQWIATSVGFDLLDMPGVLWPKFDDRAVGENLAAVGSIKDAVLDTLEIAAALSVKLRSMYPDQLAARYKLGDMAQYNDLSQYDLLQVIAKKRGFLLSGGEVDIDRCALMLLDEFRSAKIGRITLDIPKANKTVMCAPKGSEATKESCSCHEGDTDA